MKMLHDGVFLFVYIVSHACESKGGLYVNVKLHFFTIHYMVIHFMFCNFSDNGVGFKDNVFSSTLVYELRSQNFKLIAPTLE